VRIVRVAAATGPARPLLIRHWFRRRKDMFAYRRLRTDLPPRRCPLVDPVLGDDIDGTLVNRNPLRIQRLTVRQPPSPTALLNLPGLAIIREFKSRPQKATCQHIQPRCSGHLILRPAKSFTYGTAARHWPAPIYSATAATQIRNASQPLGLLHRRPGLRATSPLAGKKTS